MFQWNYPQAMCTFPNLHSINLKYYITCWRLWEYIRGDNSYSAGQPTIWITLWRKYHLGKIMGSLTLNDWLFLSVIFLMWTTFPPQNKPKLLYVWPWFSNKRLGTCPCVFSCTGNQSIFIFLLSKKSAKYVKGCLCNWGFSYVHLSNKKNILVLFLFIRTIQISRNHLPCHPQLYRKVTLIEINSLQ